MNSSRNYNLDILRIAAALMVLLVHIGYSFPWLGGFTQYGFYGTTVFFAMSGYLTMKSLENSSFVGEFYKKRFLRIIPLYWFVLLIIMIFDCIRGLFSIKFLRYFLFLQMFAPSDDFGRWNNRNGLWTMSAFCFFYLVAPIIYRIFRKFYVALIAFWLMFYWYNPFVEWVERRLLMSDASCSEPYNFAIWNPVAVFWCFFAGVVIYLADKERKQIVFVLTLALYVAFTGFERQPWNLILIILTAAAVSIPTIKPVEGMKAVKTLSGMSFALYLIHPVVLEIVMPLENILVPIIRNKGFMGFVVIMCFLAAFLVWKYVEVPLGNKLVKNL